MPGVSIGHGAIVASRSVVGSDVPPYAIVAGNPAVVVRRRFSPTTVDELLAVAWWEWPVDKISRNLRSIVGADIEALRASI
jgi:virginiamycin A acetyltransferase